MVSMRAQSPTSDDTKGNSDANALVKMCATMDKLHRKN